MTGTTCKICFPIVFRYQHTQVPLLNSTFLLHFQILINRYLCRKESNCSAINSTSNSPPQKNHLLFNLFFLTIGLVTRIPTTRPAIVNTNCFLLNPSLNKSKVPDGAVRVKNISKPSLNTSDVDSKSEGAVVIRRIWATSYEWESTHFGLSGRTGSYCVNPSSSSELDGL